MLRPVQISTSPGFSAAVAGAVAAIEETTAAEIVVAVHPRQSRLRTSALLGALALGQLALVWCLWTELSIREEMVAVVVPVGMLLGALSGQLLEHWLEPASRARTRTLQRTHAALVGLGVHRTRARTGLVVLVDETEGRVGLAVDAGIEGAVPMGRLSAVPLGQGAEHDQLSSLGDFLRGLRALGRVLAASLPADPHDNPDELPDAPRVLA